MKGPTARLVFRILVFRVPFPWLLVLQVLLSQILLFRSTEATEVLVIRLGLIT